MLRPVRDGVVARPGLFERLAEAQRVVQVSAPAGSGKTVLLRSWIAEAGLAGRAAWVSVPGEERDPQRFWISVLDALRGTAAGSELVRPLTAAPDLDGWTVVERLLEDLASLEDRVWLVIDDLHELCSAEALRQLELLIMRAPAALRFVLVTRHDLRLGLHRLRLAGELTEIRAADLRFSPAEARALFDAAGVALSDSALDLLYERTEGWAAGLRLAALSLAGHPDPERFAAEFCGSERTVAEYLLAEVLERQPEEVRRLLLRTSVLERVNGELADLLTGGSGGERVLQQLEEAGAFVVSLDARRSWFRYHQLFADLLQLELRGDRAGRAARAARRRRRVVRRTRVSGRGGPPRPGRAGLGPGRPAAVGPLGRPGPGRAGRHRARAPRPVPGRRDRRGCRAGRAGGRRPAGPGIAGGGRTVPGARHPGAGVGARGPARARAGRARRRADAAGPPARGPRGRGRGGAAAAGPRRDRRAGQLGLGGDLRALALIDLGIAEMWTGRFEEADRHLERGHRPGPPDRAALPGGHRPGALGAAGELAVVPAGGGAGPAGDRAGHASTAGPRSRSPASPTWPSAWRWSPRDGSRRRSGRSARPSAPSGPRSSRPPGCGCSYGRGMLEFVSGRHEPRWAPSGRPSGWPSSLVTPHTLAPRLRSHLLQTLVRMGETQRVEQALAEMDGRGARPGRDAHRRGVAAARPGRPGRRRRPRSRPSSTARLRCRTPICGRSRRSCSRRSPATRSATRAPPGVPSSGRSTCAEPEGLLFPFLYDPAPELLDRHRRHGTAHAALIAEILNVLAGQKPGSPPAGPQHLREPLSHAETRVLRYLPTKLSAPEIADELYLSVNTVKTHMRHLYDKLGAHRRHEAVEQARALGLLAPSPRRP